MFCQTNLLTVQQEDKKILSTRIEIYKKKKNIYQSSRENFARPFGFEVNTLTYRLGRMQETH